MALGEKRNGSVFATAAQRRDAAEYQAASEPEIVPVVAVSYTHLKSRAELKRFIRSGVEFKTVSHANHADMVLSLIHICTGTSLAGADNVIRHGMSRSFSNKTPALFYFQKGEQTIPASPTEAA